MSVVSGRGPVAFTYLTRAGVTLGLAALVLFGANRSLQNAFADGETRTLTLHHVHTGETLTVTYKRDGRYDDAALKKLDWELRDWRRNETIRMDPRLFDILWRVYQETGATKPIEIICGYRSPRTNAMLRARSGGVAKLSQHMLGKAIDFFIPGVPLAKLRAAGLQLQRGGVGFYPTSGSPFVHMDVGSVRHWPGISRAQLVKIFPHGRTVHVPSDGHPLPGYAQALAEIERRGSIPSTKSLRSARAAGLITEHEERVAELVGKGRRDVLRTLVASGRDNGSARGEEAPLSTKLASLASIKKVPHAEQPVRVASALPTPMPQSRPKLMAAAETSSSAESPPRAVGALTSGLFDRRGYWQAGVDGQRKPPALLEVASADPTPTGSTGGAALAYAATQEAPSASADKAAPMGARPAHVGAPQAVSAAGAPFAPITAMAKSTLGSAMAIGGQRLGSPWMRAAMLTPSVAKAMRVTRLGDLDLRSLQDLLHKPAQSLAMTFSNDQQGGLVSTRFTGNAVVFLATTRFYPQQTASLR
ncbi:MAG TPA: DUF882 domain-containing protein [Pseudolabrys sp.]|nr:DUF882 domain-containing protein [Pseudolabrys sp.]